MKDSSVKNIMGGMLAPMATDRVALGGALKLLSRATHPSCDQTNGYLDRRISLFLKNRKIS